MKASPVSFFVPTVTLTLLTMVGSGSLALGQTPPSAGYGLAPGAVQAPNYRPSGSAYQPTPPRNQPQARPTAAPQAPQGYQSGYGTQPNGYRPMTPKSSAKAPVKAPVKSTPSSKPKSSSIESKVAKLEQNDALQDRRLGNLERGAGGSSRTIEGDFLPITGSRYTVKSGDTLWRIADRHNTSINAIRSANRLPGETIAVGQTLFIPGFGSSSATSSATSSHGSEHTVAPGETFSQLALRYGVSQDALARANPSAYPDRLMIGEVLVIPGKKGSSSTPSYLSPSKPQTSNTSTTHIVGRGESLGAIAKKYGVSTASVASANKLKNANVIEPGQRLIIPGRNRPQVAETTRSIAREEPETTPLPELRLSTPSPIPSPAPPLYVDTVAQTPVLAATAPAPKTPPLSTNNRGIVAYRLERGDDINTVANLFNTTPEKIRELNKMPADKKITEGDEVVVPSMGAVSLN